MKSFLPTLYKTDARGRKIQWQVWTEAQADKTCMLGTIYGLVGGRLQEHTVHITSGKNLGRANATTPITQALAEAQSLWTEAVERKGYSRDGQTREQSGVMLAVDYHNLAKRKRGVDLPPEVIVDPKLDGIRAKFLDNARQEFVSRRELPYRAIPDRIRNYLRGRGQFDGEMYIHGIPLRTLNGLVNKPREDLTPRLEYHVFDLPIPRVPVEERKAMLVDMLDNEESRSCGVFVVSGERIKAGAVPEKKQLYESQGYEGIMIRLLGSEYLFHNKRSYSLIKWKDFIDSEFLCTGVKRDRDGHALLEMVTAEGVPFDCTPKGEDGWKEDLLEHPEKVVGSMCTVRYQGFQDSGRPQFARVLVERIYE